MAQRCSLRAEQTELIFDASISPAAFDDAPAERVQVILFKMRGKFLMKELDKYPRPGVVARGSDLRPEFHLEEPRIDLHPLDQHRGKRVAKQRAPRQRQSVGAESGSAL